MAISGSLKDVAVTDVLQFVHLGRRSGTLALTRDQERAVLAFHLGRLVSAQAPRTPKLGDLLLDSGTIDRAQLGAAVQAQLRSPARTSLGQILLANGALTAQQLRDAVERRIEQAVAEVVTWEHGTFDFALDELPPVDDVALAPADVLPDADVNTEMVLLEAARIFEQKDAGAEEAPPPAPPTAAAAEREAPPVERLRRVFGELRSGLISATVALNLMHLISESFERAVLFLVKRDHMAVLGAFGADRAGRPLAELLRGMHLALDHPDALARAVATGEVQVLDFGAAHLPEPMASRLGAPRSGEVVVFPVLGSQRVIAAVYADNGERAEKARNIDVLELAAAQVGMAFENELLRRQIATQHKDS